MGRAAPRTERQRRRGGAPWVEIAHAETLLERGEEVWNWSSPAGQRRRARRVDLVVESLGLRTGSRRVLELGCGTGLFTEQIAPHCRELVAMDISPALLGRARERIPTPHVRFVRQNLEEIDASETGGAFDAVYGISILHHLDLERALPRLAHLLAPGADLAFSEPNLLNPQVRLMFSRFRWARRRWAVTDSEMAFYPRELSEVFQRHGFQVLRAFPFDFLHPAIPAAWIPLARRFEAALERTPLLRALAGSCFVHARLAGA